VSTDATIVRVSTAPDATTVRVGAQDATVVRTDTSHTTVVAAAALGPQGLKGDKGDRGDPGSGTASYHHQQLTPSATWDIVHNLGYHPSVFIADSAGTVVVGDMQYIDANHLVVTFSSGFAGDAYLS
jgi:hypothetical protein